MDFVNNSEQPKRDGKTIYKINQKTHNRIEVGTLVGGNIYFNKPTKSISEVKNINTYRHKLQVYNEGSLGYVSHSDNREVLVREGLITWSIGYWEDGVLILWSQYE